MKPACAAVRRVLISTAGAVALAGCSSPAAVGAQPPKGEPSRTAIELADQVASLRVFLTEDPAQVIGRIRIQGTTSLKELEVPLEQGAVRFSDDGRAPDLAAGDGEFSARFAMDSRAEFAAARGRLGESTAALGEAKQGEWLSRGPRDLVPAEQLLEILRKMPDFQWNSLLEMTRLLRDAKDPMDAAQRVAIDFHTTPFMEIPVWAADPARLEPQRLFGLPVFDVFRFPPAWRIDPSRSLSVTALGVVEDPDRTYDGCTGMGTPDGAWSFGHLMRELSQGSGLTPEQFTLQWISTWLSPQTVNDIVIADASRAAFVQSRIIDSWQALSGAALDVDRFPARLLAIVSRPDLADRVGYGAAGSAGEGRLVFGLQRRTSSGTCQNERFTVIFEYGIRGGSCTATRAWHRRWRDLGAFTPGGTDYNATLEAITREFTDHGSNPAQLPNQSSLNQLRTNQAFDTLDWEQREFQLRGPLFGTLAGSLGMVPVKQTPRETLNHSTVLSDWVVANEGSILANRHVVPARYPGTDAFMSPASLTTTPSVLEHWNVDMTRLAHPAETRRKFSLNTCDACHGGETATGFLHIGVREPGNPSNLSGFLTGIDVDVPVTHEIHHYHDLAERARKLDDIVSSSCFRMLALRKPFVH